MIATWARTHDELVEAAIEANKHVMVEKPFTLELAPAKRLTEMAEARGLKIVVTQQWRYLPGQRTVRRLMTEEAYGEPQTGHMFSYKARGSEYPDSEHSQLWQMTVHEIDSLIAMVNRRVVEVSGTDRGRVASVVANPAGDLLELVDGTLVPLRFVVDSVPGERIDVDVPDGLFEAETEP